MPTLQITMKDLAMKRPISGVIVATGGHSYSCSIAQLRGLTKIKHLQSRVESYPQTKLFRHPGGGEESLQMFAEWAPATGLFNRRYGVRSGF